MKTVSMSPEPLLPPSPTLVAPSTLAKAAIPAASVREETSKKLLDALNPFSVAVKAMPDTAKIALLRDEQTRFNHPAWLTALKEDGLFAKPIFNAIEAGTAHSNGNFEQSCVTIDQLRSQPHCGTGSGPECLIEGGHPLFAALAMNLTTAKTKKPLDLENYDPDTGDRMQLAQFFRNHTGWAPSVLTELEAPSLQSGATPAKVCP